MILSDTEFGKAASMTLTADVAKKYPNRIFIETGTGNGGGIQTALDAGFPLVFSIESDREKWFAAAVRFKANPAVTCILGDSSEMLSSLLKAVAEPCTIWLDAHGNDFSPIKHELAAILSSPHAHTVLIDDIRNYEKGKYGWGLGNLTALLDPLFVLSREPNFTGPEDILVAKSRAAK